MNADPRFGRVRIRGTMESLLASGLTTDRIADAAMHLGRAREALDAVTAAVLQRACRTEGDGILVESAALMSAPREIGLRALAAVLMAVSEQTYRPRFEALERLFDTIARGELGRGRTLHGCRIGPAPGSHAVFETGALLIARENTRKTGKIGQKPVDHATTGP